MQRVVDVEQFNLLKTKSRGHNEILEIANKIDNRLIGDKNIEDIKRRPRMENYTGKTAIPYWEYQ